MVSLARIALQALARLDYKDMALSVILLYSFGHRLRPACYQLFGSLLQNVIETVRKSLLQRLQGVLLWSTDKVITTAKSIQYALTVATISSAVAAGSANTTASQERADVQVATTPIVRRVRTVAAQLLSPIPENSREISGNSQLNSPRHSRTFP